MFKNVYRAGKIKQGERRLARGVCDVSSGLRCGLGQLPTILEVVGEVEVGELCV